MLTANPTAETFLTMPPHLCYTSVPGFLGLNANRLFSITIRASRPWVEDEQILVEREVGFCSSLLLLQPGGQFQDELKVLQYGFDVTSSKMVAIS
jgi:hypothetical protein